MSPHYFRTDIAAIFELTFTASSWKLYVSQKRNIRKSIQICVIVCVSLGMCTYRKATSHSSYNRVPKSKDLILFAVNPWLAVLKEEDFLSYDKSHLGSDLT